MVGFRSTIANITERHPGARVIGALLNSDVIENMFSSQRSRCNGANTNPTTLQYSKAINTIVMTSERRRSGKRNAASDSSVGGAFPYKILAGKTFSERRISKS